LVEVREFYVKKGYPNHHAANVSRHSFREMHGSPQNQLLFHDPPRVLSFATRNDFEISAAFHWGALTLTLSVEVR